MRLPTPCIVVLTGPPLHGKTAVGRRLEQQFRFIPYDVDEIKAELLTADATRRGEEYDFSKGTLPEVLAAIYQVSVNRAQMAAEMGNQTVLTGTFSKPEFKASLLALLEEQNRLAPLPGYRPLLVPIFRLNVSSYDTIARRIEQRIVEGHPSSIKSREKYENSLKLVSPWPDGLEVTDIDADRPLEEVVADIAAHIPDLRMGA